MISSSYPCVSDQTAIDFDSQSLQQQPLTPTSTNEKSRKLSLKEKRKLRAERELTPRDLDLAAAAEAAASAPIVAASMASKGVKSHLVAPQPPEGKSGVSPTGAKSSESDQSVSPIKGDEATTMASGEANNGSSSSNGVLMRTTSREFAVSRALGKYREKQKKQHYQQSQHRTSIGSNSDSQEDLDNIKTPTPKTSPPRISMIEEDETGIEMEQSVDSPGAEAELANLGAKLAQFGDSMRPVEEFVDSDQQLPQEHIPGESMVVPESSSSEEVLESSDQKTDENMQQQQQPQPQRRPSEELRVEMATVKAEKAAAEAAKQTQKMASETAKTGLALGKTAFGMFGASKFGKMAMGAAAQAAQAAKEAQAQELAKQQQQRSGQPSGQTSRASSALGSVGGSRRHSTEESIDTDDEWYRHEIRELEQKEYEKNLENIKPSASVNEKMNHVLIELAATVPRIELEICQAFDREMRAKQSVFPPPRLVKLRESSLLRIWLNFGTHINNSFTGLYFLKCNETYFHVQYATKLTPFFPKT